MTPQDRISIALVARGLLPLDGYCTCAACDADDLDRAEIADAGTHNNTKQLEEHFGGRVCTTCADETRTCEGCGDICDTQYCDDCDRDAAQWERHCNAERAALRRI